jgi:hypothetical protein
VRREKVLYFQDQADFSILSDGNMGRAGSSWFVSLARAKTAGFCDFRRTPDPKRRERLVGCESDERTAASDLWIFSRMLLIPIRGTI